MQAAAMTSRFPTGCSSKAEFADSEIVVSHVGLIQHVVVTHLARTVYSRETLLRLTNALIRFAERAYTLRDRDALQESSNVLINLPIDAARQVGLYYRALAINRRGQTDEAKTLLETVAGNAPIAYRARAIQTLGGIHHDSGQLDEALRFQLEVLRAASDKNAHGLQTTLMAELEIATIKGLNEDHKGALAILESLSPLVQIVSRQNPLYFYFYHNELAVEFGELGRVAEAEAACKIALSYPFASAYPEWAETRQEIEAKRMSATPSVVAINRAPEAEPSPQIEPQRKPEPLRARGLSRLASKKDSFQTTVISIAATTVLNRSGNTLLIVYCLRKSVRTRGPPPLSQGTFRSPSESIVESADENARAGQNRFAAEFFCARSYRLIAATSARVSLCCRNYISRAPPLGRDGEFESGSLNRLATTSNVHSFKAYDDQHLQLGLVPRREVNPHSQLGFQRIWAGRGVCDSLPTLSAQVRVEELSITNTRACAGGYL